MGDVSRTVDTIDAADGQKRDRTGSAVSQSRPPSYREVTSDCYHDLSPREIEEFHEAVDANYSSVSEIRGIAIYRRRPPPSK